MADVMLSDQELAYQAYQFQKGQYFCGIVFEEFYENHWPSQRSYHEAVEKKLAANPFPEVPGTEAKLKALYMRHIENSLSNIGNDLAMAKSADSRGDKMARTRYLQGLIASSCEATSFGQQPSAVLRSIGVADPARWQAAAQTQIMSALLNGNGSSNSSWMSFHNKYKDNFSSVKFQAHFRKVLSKTMAPPRSVSRTASRAPVASAKPAGLLGDETSATLQPQHPNKTYSYEQLVGIKDEQLRSFTFEQLLGSRVEEHQLSAEVLDLNNKVTDKLREAREKARKKKEELKRRWQERRARKAAEREERRQALQRQGVPAAEIDSMIGCHHDSDSDMDYDEEYNDYEDDDGEEMADRMGTPDLEASSGNMESPSSLSRDSSPDFEEPVGNFEGDSFTFVQVPIGSAAPSAAPSPVLGTRPGLVKRDQLTGSPVVSAAPAVPTPVRPGLRPAAENPVAVQKLLQASGSYAQVYLKTFLQQHGSEFRNQSLVFLAPSNQMLQSRHASFVASPAAQVNFAAEHLFSDPEPSLPLRNLALNGITESSKQVSLNNNSEIVTDKKRVATAPSVSTHVDNKYNIRVRIMTHNSFL